ncbi:hypothetical protein UFOVP786_15 [uncultured Caudovirales phage]|uniref:Uncharacterized protein n=1 Tax=uncultured Caudovirales phage TaxID=2100421 RepID=A0A6J5NXB4_9CAUD|nr:hypothetical protein UFOVP786_15 [uncultured Caudovirales phage]
MKPDLRYRLPVRPEVQTVTCHRNPTESELRFGHGAIHYCEFSVQDACHKGTRILKRWFKSSHDGLRYYR